MKPYIKYKLIATFAFLLFLLLSQACKKKTSDSSTCKTCKAFGIDGLIKEQEVCTEEAETSFRTTYAGKEIICQ